MNAFAPLLISFGPLLSGADADLENAIAETLPQVVAWRRDIHEHPELGEREVRTAGLVAAHLRAIGFDEVHEEVAVTGVRGVLRGGRPGGVVAYRADMDALPILERTELPFASKVQDRWNNMPVGVMHACGHDLHTAIGLGVATVLARPEVRAELPGTVVFLFQPAEEGHPDPGTHGAERMLEEGVFEEPRPGAVFGLHCNPRMKVGEVALTPGGAMAAADRFEIEIQGQQTHGAYPHSGVDPIVAASHVVLALQTIASRETDPLATVVVTVGSIQAGNRFNIIPDSAKLVGTIRTHDTAVQDAAHASLERIATRTAEALGATATVTIDRMCPVTYNDLALRERLLPVAARTATVVEEAPHMGAEDFAFFANEVPGLYYFLGTTPLDEAEPAMIHTPFFDPDEGALEVGLRTSCNLLLTWLEDAAE